LSEQTKQPALGRFAVLINRAIQVFAGFLIKFQPLGRFDGLVCPFGTRAIHAFGESRPVAFVGGLPGFFLY